jgi:hypothetical protein
MRGTASARDSGAVTSLHGGCVCVCVKEGRGRGGGELSHVTCVVLSGSERLAGAVESGPRRFHTHADGE